MHLRLRASNLQLCVSAVEQTATKSCLPLGNRGYAAGTRQDASSYEGQAKSLTTRAHGHTDVPPRAHADARGGGSVRRPDDGSLRPARTAAAPGTGPRDSTAALTVRGGARWCSVVPGARWCLVVLGRATCGRAAVGLRLSGPRRVPSCRGAAAPGRPGPVQRAWLRGRPDGRPGPGCGAVVPPRRSGRPSRRAPRGRPSGRV